MSRLTKNILFTLIGQSIIILVALFSIKFIFQRLGGEALGIIYFVSTLNAVLLASLNKGVSSTLIREIAIYIHKNQDYLKRLIQTWSALCWCAYILLSFIIYFLAPIFVEKWIQLKSIDAATATWMLRVLSIAALLALPKSLYWSIMAGLQRMEFINLINVSAAILQKLGIIIILINNGGLQHVIYWMAAVYIAEVLAGYTISCRLLSFVFLVPRYRHDALVKNIRFSLHMISISILGIFQKQADRICLSKFLPVELLGYYAFAFNNVSKALIVSQSIARAAYPHLCDKFSNADHQSLIGQYKQLQDLSCFINVPLFAAMPFLTLPLFTYIFNFEVAKSLQLPVFILSLGFYLNGSMTIPYRLLLAAGKPEIASRQNLYGTVAGLPLTIILVYFWHLNGAALAIVFYFIVAYFYSVPKIFKNCLQIPAYIFFKHLMRIFILAASTYGVSWIFLAVLKHQTLGNFILVYMFASIAFIIGAFFLVDEELKKSIILLLRRIINAINLRFHSLNN